MPLHTISSPEEDILASSTDLAQVLAQFDGGRDSSPRRRRPKPAAAEQAPAPPLLTRTYCRCGRCKWCLDNVRWERIFNEKFADPSYYGGITVRHRSSLAEAR